MGKPHRWIVTTQGQQTTFGKVVKNFTKFILLSKYSNSKLILEIHKLRSDPKDEGGPCVSRNSCKCKL